METLQKDETLTISELYMRLEETETPDKYGICTTNLRIFM